MFWRGFEKALLFFILIYFCDNIKCDFYSQRLISFKAKNQTDKQTMKKRTDWASSNQNKKAKKSHTKLSSNANCTCQNQSIRKKYSTVFEALNKCRIQAHKFIKNIKLFTSKDRCFFIA